ncbi:hypothetical protein [Planctomyces sp. SH-PL62]|uniref:hypothetical protein n=1 Tax=Planctomyces sp. SH-PL62 TaxID=1636152 RepID=UPI00078E0AB4|nr:hypothetical protein [Planctomyces sp. SH-PL62]AMV37174.1 hypothetical protein VT85_07065 [Planctomyces sp. SH-PL62]
MSELGALQRASTASRRRGGVQRRLNMPVAEASTLAAPQPFADGPPAVRFRRPRKAAPALRPEPVDRTPPPPVFHPLAYRSVVAAWSLDARERWGRRSNELEDEGLSWRDAETQAFVEVWNHLRREGGFADPGPC